MRVEIGIGKRKKTDALVAFAIGTGADALGSLPASVRSAAAKVAPAEPGADGVLFTAGLADGPAERLYVFGAGKKATLSPRKARGLVKAAVAALNRAGEKTATFDLPFGLDRMSGAEARDFLWRALLLADYRFTAYKSEPAPLSLKTAHVASGRGAFEGVSEKDAARELRDATAVAEASRLVRDLGNTPSNDMVPRDFADAVRKEAKKRGVQAKVLDLRGIAKERMGGLLAVNRGAVEEPRFVVLEWRGGKKSEKPVALVGKGVTFDSGGISIKPADRMGDMKWDMLGAATACAAVLAAADLKLPVNVMAFAPLTENLPSGTAYKPGDIVRFRSGKTAEIDNTDAEGRVILADALDYAAEWKPAVIVDFATLTGAALVALGLEAAIAFSDDDALVAQLVSAGERTDERLWRLPLWEEYRDNIRSDWADMKNTGGRYGGSINGAWFLKEFVPKDTPWCHLDIAPTAYYERDYAGYPVGATSFGVAMTVRWLRDRLGATKPARKK